MRLLSHNSEMERGILMNESERTRKLESYVLGRLVEKARFFLEITGQVESAMRQQLTEPRPSASSAQRRLDENNWERFER
jgi:hypothetical protein